MNEVEYINKISPFLERFRETSKGKYNFKCPICGDGRTGFKSRAWFLERDTYYFHCFNCSEQSSFPNFLKSLFPDIYKEYVFDKLRTKERDLEVSSIFIEKPDIDYSIHNYVKSLFKPYTESEAAIQYLNGRNLPSDAYNSIYIIENFKDLNRVEKYKDSNFLKETRIVIPIYNKNGVINGIISRAISEDSVKRYIILKFYDDYDIFGLYDEKGNYKINLNKTIYVVEGAFDSMFIDNAVSVNTSDLMMFSKSLNKRLIDKLNVVYVPDNDTRNKEIVKIYKKIIEAGKNIVILPEYIKGKDINEIILNNDVDIMQLLKDNTFKGVEATIKMNMWKKI
jgi:DNA primase